MMACRHGGAPDQTFDDWPLQGVSAYCGALWIAALEAALAMAQRLQLDLGLETSSEQREFGEWLEQSRANFDRLLWNGDFYRIDAESGTPVVMADQLCGDRAAAGPAAGGERCQQPQHAQGGARGLF